MKYLFFLLVFLFFVSCSSGTVFSGLAYDAPSILVNNNSGLAIDVYYLYGDEKVIIDVVPKDVQKYRVLLPITERYVYFRAGSFIYSEIWISKFRYFNNKYPIELTFAIK